jgi:hypothetical protein
VGVSGGMNAASVFYGHVSGAPMSSNAAAPAGRAMLRGV